MPHDAPPRRRGDNDHDHIPTMTTPHRRHDDEPPCRPRHVDDTTTTPRVDLATSTIRQQPHPTTTTPPPRPRHVDDTTTTPRVDLATSTTRQRPHPNHATSTTRRQPPAS